MAEPGTPGPDDEAVRRFIARFAATMEEVGFPPMPARAFVALLVSDTGRLGLAELASLLQASPGTISVAMRYLTQMNLARREREPGTRRDLYQIQNDSWHEVQMHQGQAVRHWAEAAREGLATFGKDTPAGERLEETLAFFEFLQKEQPELLARWRAHRDQLRAARS